MERRMDKGREGKEEGRKGRRKGRRKWRGKEGRKKGREEEWSKEEREKGRVNKGEKVKKDTHEFICNHQCEHWELRDKVGLSLRLDSLVVAWWLCMGSGMNGIAHYLKQSHHQQLLSQFIKGWTRVLLSCRVWLPSMCKAPKPWAHSPVYQHRSSEYPRSPAVPTVVHNCNWLTKLGLLAWIGPIAYGFYLWIITSLYMQMQKVKVKKKW